MELHHSFPFSFLWNQQLPVTGSVSYREAESCFLEYFAVLCPRINLVCQQRMDGNLGQIRSFICNQQ